MEAIPTYATIVLKSSTMLDTMIKNFTVEGYNSLVSYLTKPIGSLCVLYIVLTGYRIAMGYSDKPANEFKNIVLRIGLVFMFAVNWGYFSSYGVDLFVYASENLGAHLMKVFPIEIPALTDAFGIKGTLQAVAIEFARVGQWVTAHGSLTNLTPYFTGFSIMGFGWLVVAVAFFEIYSAKLILAVCLTFAPLFIPLTLFEKTRAFFDKWLGFLVGYSLVFVFISSILGICMKLMHVTVAEHYLSKAINVGFTDWLPVAFMGLLCVKSLLEVTGIAKGIGGACKSSESSALVGGMVGAAMGASRTGASATSKTAGLGMKGVKGLAALTPKGAIAQLGAAAAKKMTQGASTMKGMQNNMRKGPITREVR